MGKRSIYENITGKLFVSEKFQTQDLILRQCPATPSSTQILVSCGSVHRTASPRVFCRASILAILTHIVRRDLLTSLFIIVHYNKQRIEGKCAKQWFSGAGISALSRSNSISCLQLQNRQT